MSKPTESFTEEERQALLRLARETIARRLTGDSMPVPAPEAVAARRAGAFVTVRRRGDLRGCIGHIGADRPLVEVVRQCAIAAATEDPRFAPLSAEELEEVELEVSVLGPMEKVSDPREITVGRHGVIISEGRWRGLLLPQVATEQGWDRETFLSHACLKAGLRPDAWKTGAEIVRFEATVFSE